MKLILFPLTMLICMSMLSVMGITTDLTTYNLNGTMVAGGSATADWYDSTDHPLCYRNFTKVSGGEDGTVISGGNHWGDVWYWRNATSTYQMYNAEGGEQPLADSAINFNAGTSIGLIGIILGLMAFATIAGLKVFGTGTSENSVLMLIKGVGFLALWAVFSVLALSLITAVPLLGPVFYFFLTALYTMGIIGQVGSGGDD